MRTRGTAILLCLFLGGIGAHRFYLGQTKTAFLFLFFCWTFIPLLYAIIDLIDYCFLQNDETFNKTYNAEYLKVMTPQADHTKDLESLANLFEKNLLTKEEFEQKKEILLKKII